MASAPRIRLITDRDHAELTPSDKIYAEALRELGAEVAPLIWNEADDGALRQADLLVVRAIWDTWTGPDAWTAHHAFLAKLKACGTPVCNELDVLAWGLDKERLGELAAQAALRTPESLFFDTPEDAQRAFEERAWEKGVLKPTIGGSGYGVSLLEAGKPAPADLPQSVGRWMLQEFLPEIHEGELNVVVIDGAVSHMVRKTPAENEWRSNWKFGPIWRAEPVLPAAADAASRAVGFFERPPLYMRVDGVVTARGFVMIECEVESPSLFFTFVPQAAARMAAATLARLDR